MRLLLQISALLICILAQEQRAKRGAEFVPYRTGKKVASQVSTALDRLLFFSGYENYLMLDSLSTRGRLLDEGAMLDENFTQQYQIRS